MHHWARALWRFNRSLTGEGNRRTLQFLRSQLSNLNIRGIPSGAKVFDWCVPQEWACREGFIVTPTGNKICNFAQNNLHLVGYSVPVNRVMPLQELRRYLHYLPSQPRFIPYVTSYYDRNWGFCLTFDEYKLLPDGDYHVFIDSEHFDGEMIYADMLIQGSCDSEILLSTYFCHPSMANNELSGPVLVTMLGRWLLENQKRLKYSYRLVYVPETVGAIAYLSQNHEHLSKSVIAGYQVTCVGDDRAYSYVSSPYGDTISDEVARSVLSEVSPDYKAYSYLDRGSDERQYCSPNLRLPIASICRSKYGTYPEYHTSADDLINVVTPQGLQGAFDVYIRCIERIENKEWSETSKNRALRSGCPLMQIIGEPQLGRRGLYHEMGHGHNPYSSREIINIIAYCDGSNDAKDIAAITGIDESRCLTILSQLASHKLVAYV
jgi:aminopeptidase-like protein